MLTSTQTRADWHVASGENFVVYANQSPKKIQRYAEKLERYHAALGVLIQDDGTSPSPSNRVTVYVVSGRREVKKLYGDGANRNLLGFYKGRAGGSIAIVPRISGSAKGMASNSERTLLHEYAHHFMFSNNQTVVPRWFSEGFAEFYSTAKFGKEGGIGLGLPALHRINELEYAHHVPLQEIFDTRLYLEKKTERYDNFYGRSWQLYHYLFFSKERRGQISSYFAQLEQGTSEPAAALQSFGSLKTLNSELNAYKRQKRIDYLNFEADFLKIDLVSVRKLSAGEAAAVPVIMRSKLGVSLKEANKLLPKARKLAAKFPSNAVVLGALAEAEVDAQNYSEAIAAADSALAIDTDYIQAHIQKGLALEHLAEDVEGMTGKHLAWKAVRRQFLKANRIEPDNPLPLQHFYQSYVREGIEPTKNSVDGLERALILAPFDRTVRGMLARQQMAEERYADVRNTLVPLAYGPHQKDDNDALVLLREAERKLAEALDAG